MTRIALICATGMSTSMLVSRMRQAAAAQGVDAEIDAYPEHELASRSDSLDVVLLGPQVGYLLDKSKAACAPKGVPVAVIPSMDYGMMDGAKVLALALSLKK